MFSIVPCALGGGYGLVADPSGAAIGLPPELLQASPFSDYLMLGLVLPIVLGSGPLWAAYGVWTRRRWGRTVGLFAGVALVIWIGVQTWPVGFHFNLPLQPLFALVGAAIILLASLTKHEAHESRR